MTTCDQLYTDANHAASNDGANNDDASGFSAQHVKLLKLRAIKIEIARAARLWSYEPLSDAEKKWMDRYPGLKALFRDEHEVEFDVFEHLPVPGLYIPYQRVKATGERPCRFRSDVDGFSRTNKDGIEGTHTETEWIEWPRYMAKKGAAVPYLPMFFETERGALAPEFQVADDAALFVAEAPLKALSLWSHEYAAIGLGGVTAGFHDVKTKRATGTILLHEELLRLRNIRERTWYLAFDAGQTDNPRVALGLAFGWMALKNYGVNDVRNVVVPPKTTLRSDPKARDQGPDDFLAANGKDAFQLLVEQAYNIDPLERVAAVAAIENTLERTRAARDLGRDLVFRACLYVMDKAELSEVALVSKERAFGQRRLNDLKESFRTALVAKHEAVSSEEEMSDGGEPIVLDHPSNAEVAQVLVQKIADKYSPSLKGTDPLERVVGDLGSVWTYGEKTGIWEELGQAALSREIQAMDGARVKGTDRRWYVQSTGSVADMVHAQVERPEFFAAGPRGKGFKNGFVVVEINETGNSRTGSLLLKPHAPSNRIRHAYDFEYREIPEGTILPMVSRYFQSALRGTDDVQAKINMLLAHAGLCILGEGTFPNAAILLFDDGLGGSGKSVWLELVGSMFSDTLKTAVSPQDMSDGSRAEYYRHSMARAHINILSEVPSSELLGGSFVKALFDGNRVGCREPCGTPYYCAMVLGHLFSLNGLFPVREPTQALFDRFITVKFPNRVRGTKADAGRAYWKSIRDAELPQLIVCCLLQAAAVLAQGAFPIPASCLKARDEWMSGCDAADQFLRERQVPVSADRQPWDGASKDGCWIAFKEWAERNKQSRNMGRKVFWQRLSALVGEPDHFETGNRYPFRLKSSEELDGAPRLRVVEKEIDVEEILKNV